MNVEIKAPKVSIVLPTYNRAGLISRAVKSILEQTYSDFELIVIDDCSTDATAPIISGFNDPRIKYIFLSKHNGAAFARNEGLKIAFGEFIAFADSDDVWLKEKLEKQVKVLKNAPDDLGVVYSAVWKVQSKRKVFFPDRSLGLKRSGDIYKNLLFGNFLTIHVLLRSTCLRRLGMFDEKLPCLQDWELWLRLAKKYKVFYINQPLVLVYRTPDAISEKSNDFNEALERIIKKFSKEFLLYPKLLAKYYYILGRGFYKNNNKAKSRKYLEMALDLSPFDLKYMFYVWLIGFVNKR
ncbi:MAG: glycosyltransferase [Candidatus Omnitrophica bacterium]|nr:glycosyltransferase [Candidatus Omnitrophota bacterium]